MDNRRIGVFDSGLGGLTAVKQIMKSLPNESIIYFGDTGRVPYGTRSNETILKYTRNDIRFLKTFDVKMIVIACGTASSVAMPAVKNEFDVPIVGVVDATVYAAVRATRNGRIGIIGTPGTIKSGSYERLIRKYDPSMQTFTRACPLFVPLVENGHTAPNDRVAELIAREYLSDIAAERPDAVILGCTHYPLLSGVIGNILQESVLVNSSIEAVLRIRDVLHACGLCAPPCAGGADARRMFYVSDDIDGFTENAHRFLGRNIRAELVDIDRY